MQGQMSNYHFHNKKKDIVTLYLAFGNLKVAKKTNADSVPGLHLCCAGLKTFPLEVLKYKNIKYISFKSSYIDDVDVYLSLTEAEKQNYQKNMKSGKGMHYLYKPNADFAIPKEISQLTKLEVLTLPITEFDKNNLKKIKALEALLPNVLIVPSSIDIEKDMNEFKVIEDK